MSTVGEKIWPEVIDVVPRCVHLRPLGERLSGSFARHRVTMRSTDAGVTGRSSRIGRGSVARIAAIVLDGVLPSNAFLGDEGVGSRIR
jgi:hypothetical protein